MCTSKPNIVTGDILILCWRMDVSHLSLTFLFNNSYRLHQKELDKIKDPDKRHRRLVELNVIEQCINVYKTGVVQRKRVETHQAGQEFTTPRIHGLVFDPRVGRLKRLNADFAKYTKNLNEVYDLYDAEADLTDKIYA